jgi:hypothetical protein
MAKGFLAGLQSVPEVRAGRGPDEHRWRLIGAAVSPWQLNMTLLFLTAVLLTIQPDGGAL